MSRSRFAHRMAILALAVYPIWLLAGCDYKTFTLGPSPASGLPTEPALPAAKTAPPADPAQDELVQRVQSASQRIERGAVQPGKQPKNAVNASPRPSQPVELVGFDPELTSPDRLFVEPPRPMAVRPADSALRQVAGPAAGKQPIVAAPPALADASDAPPVVLSSHPIVPGEPARAPAAPPALPAQAKTSANAPLATEPPLTPAKPDVKLADAIRDVERQAAGQPADFKTQLQLRMLYLAAGRARDASAVWAAGSATDQQTLSALIAAATAVQSSKSPGADAADPTEAALAAVERLRRQLADQAALKVQSVRLASRVDGYGVLSPFEGSTFRPGQWVIVYCELENLTSRPEPDGLHRSELSLRAEVLSSEGASMLVQEDKQVVDKSLNPRRDFFLARRLRLPGDLPPGGYVLRVSVEDKLAGKVGESMLKFEVK